MQTCIPPHRADDILDGRACVRPSRLLLGIGLVLLAAFGLWAGGVFRVKTPQGILVVEINEPNPDVYVDGDKVTVTWGADGKTAEIRLKPGTRTVEVKKEGFAALGEEVEVQDGKRRVLTARLVAAAPREPPRENPDKGGPKKEPTASPVPPDSAKVLPTSKERAEAGTYHSEPDGLPSILVQREAEGSEGWRRLSPGARVYTKDRLVSLPGYASEVRLDGGVRLFLRGHLPQFSDPQQRWMDFLLESAVVLHRNKDFDADLTLDRGRLYVSNHKETGAATVRLRFGKDAAEVWDLTLEEPGTEVGVDLLRHCTPDVRYLDGDEPRAELYLLVLRGKASVRIGFDRHTNLTGPPGPALFAWDNKGAGVRGPARVEKMPAFWAKGPPPGKEADDMVVALKELSKKMTGKTVPSLALEECRQSDRLPVRRLALYCLGALDGVRQLLDTLGDEAPGHAADREEAIFTLRRWISHDSGRSTSLYDMKTKSGLLVAAQKYRTSEAAIIVQLLHDFDHDARQSVETYQVLADYLPHEKVAIAELAWWHLRRLALRVKLPEFNAGLPRATREKAANEVRKLIADGKLPPPPPAPPPPPPVKKD